MTKASTYPWWIDDCSPIPDPFGYGERAVRFLRSLRHPGSTAYLHKFELAPWQERLVRRIYGPRHPDGTRIVKTVFLMLARGNRKTSLAAALALLHTIGPECDPSALAYFCAASRDQASLGFREAANILRQDPRVLKHVRIRDAFNSKKQIYCHKTGGVLETLASDGALAHGLTPGFTLIDEIHVWRGRDLWDALESGKVKPRDPLTIICTTAGRGAEGLAADEFNYARRVATGEVVNEEYLPVLFMAGVDDDWKDEATWHKANPGLAYGFPSLAGMRSAAKKAEESPAELSSFKQFNLNIWAANSDDPLFNFDLYDAGLIEEKDEELTKLPAYVGADLSQTGDLTAISIAFRHPGGEITLRNTCFVPEGDLPRREYRDRAPYKKWADDGLIQLCPGFNIDQMQVEEHIRELCAKYDVQEIAIDPALARVLTQRLTDDGINIFTHPQSDTLMSEATGNLIRTVGSEKLHHNGDPVLRWAFDNVALVQRPQSGLVKMHKTRSTGRIDAAVASAMAVSRAVVAHQKKSRYSDPEVTGLAVI